MSKNLDDHIKDEVEPHFEKMRKEIEAKHGTPTIKKLINNYSQIKDKLIVYAYQIENLLGVDEVEKWHTHPSEIYLMLDEVVGKLEELKEGGV